MRRTIAGLYLSCCLSTAAFATGHQPLRYVQAIALRGVEGPIDHMAIDPQRQRLFVAALGNGTVEVIDLRSAQRVQSLRGFHEPQGLAFAPSPPRLFVANGGDGTCDMLDGETLASLRTVRLGTDADNIRYDPKAGRVYLGYGSGASRALDAATGDSLGEVKLRAHPESFQLELAGSRVFVNVPDAEAISVVDRAEGRVIGDWKVEGFAANYPMALDELGHPLFVGCRRPSAVLVFDDQSGRRLATISVDGDADDLFYHALTQQLFVSCGAGYIDVLKASKSGPFTKVARIAAAPGARTALYVPTLRRLYVAVPHRGSQRAEIRVFEVE